MTPPVCVWCLQPVSAHAHETHPFVGPRAELSPRELAKLVAAELRLIAQESLGPNARVSDALDLL